MDIKLDNSLLGIINKKYNIDPSVVKEFESRKQALNSTNASINSILTSSPEAPPPPKKDGTTTDQIVSNTLYEYKLKENELNSILDLLSLSDASIDKTSELIKKIDLMTIELIDEINTAIDEVNAAYQARIDVGCRSNLIWSNIGTSTGYDPITSVPTTYTNYKVIKDPEQEVVTNYYGIKYYQKPVDRDYGFDIISEFDGSISIGSSSLAVVGLGTTGDIEVGDEITDSLSNPIAFSIGSLPKVVGFGMTSLLGVTTSIYGSVSVGSSIIAYTGIGSTENILIGDYVLNVNAFDPNTIVTGFITTITSITYYDSNTSSYITTSLTVPGIQVNQVAISSVTKSVFGFGTYTDYPTINLDQTSNSTIENKIFTAIRRVKDITINFNYNKSPIDPYMVGILDSTKVGIGHEIKIVNNGFESDTRKWRKVLNKPEPDVGAGSTVYYTGATSWPYDIFTGYANEGQILSCTEYSIPLYTSISPNGLNLNGPVCTECNQNITEAEDNLQYIISKNIPEIQKFLSAVSPLRKYRDKDQMKAWAYLQSASYLRGEMNELDQDINSLKTFDYNSL